MSFRERSDAHGGEGFGATDLPDRRTDARRLPGRIRMAHPDLREQDVEAVTRVVRDGSLAQGLEAAAFERAMAAYIGVEHAVAVSSGTAALHLIVKSLGLDRRDEVLVPSFTTPPSVNALLHEGARPVFVELDPSTFQLDVVDLERRITHSTRAIMAVDAFGAPADWAQLNRIAKRHGLLLLEDCCEALGAEHEGRKLGGFGQAGAFAFHANQPITTGEGGMLVTNRSDLAGLARSYADQGRSVPGAGPGYDRVGYGYRMDEMSAGLGRSQLGRIRELLARRTRVAGMYTERLAGLAGVEPPGSVPGGLRSWSVYVVTLEEGLDRERTIHGMAEEGVPAGIGFAPIHTQRYIRERFGDLAGTLPVTEAMARRTLALPFHAQLTEGEIDHVLAVLGRHLQ